MRLTNSIFLVTLSFCAAFSLQVEAAPAMPRDACRIEGKIVSMKERPQMIEARKNFGESGEYTYVDIDVVVKSRALFEKMGLPNDNACAPIKAPKVITYQLRADQKRPAVGQKIRALTRFGGDEFSIGDWIYEIEVLP